jgi:hypothetical protein
VGRCPCPTLLWSVPHCSCCWMPSPLQAHWGRWCHTHLLWLAPVELSSGQPLLQAFPAPRLLGGGHHSCLLWLTCLFTVHMRECPSSTLLSLGRPTLFVMCLFFFQLLVYYSVFGFFFPFFLGMGQSVQGAMLIFSGRTVCHLLAHLVICFSQAG